MVNTTIPPIYEENQRVQLSTEFTPILGPKLPAGSKGKVVRSLATQSGHGYTYTIQFDNIGKVMGVPQVKIRLEE